MAKKRAPKKPFPAKVVAIGLLACAVIIACIAGYLALAPTFASWSNRVSHTIERSRTIVQSNLVDRLTELQVPKEKIKISYQNGDSTTLIIARIPRGKPLEWIVWHLSQKVNQTSYDVTDCIVKEDNSGGVITFSSSQPNKPKIILNFTLDKKFGSATVRVALLVTRFTFSTEPSTMALLTFPEPLSLACAPSFTHGALITQLAREQKVAKEVVIALPMESIEYTGKDTSSFAMKVHFTELVLKQIVHRAQKNFPDATGFVNINGSRFLSDSRATEFLATELARTRSYFCIRGNFIRTNAQEIFSRVGCAETEVDLELPATATEADIVEKISKQAHVSGDCTISIPMTTDLAENLAKALPGLTNNGIKLVYLRDMISNHSPQE